MKNGKLLMLKILVATLLLALTALALAGCGVRTGSSPAKTTENKPSVPTASPPVEEVKAKSATEKPNEESKPDLVVEKVQYSISTMGLDILPLLLGKEKGLFLKEGIDLELPVMKSDLAVAGLVSGQIDYSQAVGPILRAAAKGMPLKGLAYINDKPLFYLLGTKDISSVKDLKGKNIGVSRLGSSGHSAAFMIVKHYGLDPQKDVNFVQVGDIANNFAALKASSVQAGIMVPPETSVAKQLGFNEIAYLGDVTTLPLSGLMASDAKIKNNPQQVKRIVRGLINSLRYTREHRQEAIDYIIKEFKLEPAIAADAYDAAAKSFSTDGWPAEDGTRNELRIAAEQGAITREEAEVPLAKVIDNRFVQEALKEISLEHK